MMRKGALVGLRRIAIYGDSLSTGSHGEGGYVPLLRERLCLEAVMNFSIGSSGLADCTPDSMVELLRKPGHLPKDPDLILVWHGSNDWYHGTPLGSLDSHDPSTFFGAVDAVVDVLRRHAPDAMLLWATPIFRWERPDKGVAVGDAFGLCNRCGHTLMEYHEALERASVRHGFPLIDMRRLSGIHGQNRDLYLEDGVHPTRSGYVLIGRVLDREIRRCWNRG
jgi:lysophospholipase L1-like esterase